MRNSHREGLHGRETAWEPLELGVNSGTGKDCGITARARCGLFAEAVFNVARFHDVFALDPHMGAGVREGTKPHAIDFSKTHQYVEIMDRATLNTASANRPHLAL